MPGRLNRSHERAWSAPDLQRLAAEAARMERLAAQVRGGPSLGRPRLNRTYERGWTAAELRRVANQARREMPLFNRMVAEYHRSSGQKKVAIGQMLNRMAAASRGPTRTNWRRR